MSSKVSKYVPNKKQLNCTELANKLIKSLLNKLTRN